MKILTLLFLSSCSTWDPRSYYEGVRDGSYSGCQYVILQEVKHKKRKWNDNDFKMCPAIYNEWEKFMCTRVECK